MNVITTFKGKKKHFVSPTHRAYKIFLTPTCNIRVEFSPFVMETILETP